ncbi:hypothetical protein COMA1_11670 [Candidatus Nitrospira nitrosa]|uniref:Uncharacterized protein n=1 Tax=Candidatus Nitrospira nitrosa TaxID=1742972 RepID=A0A0S4LB17_9BACT|nr:hypothetical protein COMA1_11670 [Candidatus Nitrospira nitrosa]
MLVVQGKAIDISIRPAEAANLQLYLLSAEFPCGRNLVYDSPSSNDFSHIHTTANPNTDTGIKPF